MTILERQIVSTVLGSRLLSRREWSGSTLRRERSSYGSGLRLYLTTNYVVGTDIIEPATLILTGINIKLDCQILTILDIELLDTILTKDVEHAPLGILTRHFKYILLSHPRITRTGRNATSWLHYSNNSSC